MQYVRCAYCNILQYIANILQYIIYCNNILYIATIYCILQQYIVYCNNISYIAIYCDVVWSLKRNSYLASTIYYPSNASSSSSSTSALAQSSGVSESKRCCTLANFESLLEFYTHSSLHREREREREREIRQR